MSVSPSLELKFWKELKNILINQVQGSVTGFFIIYYLLVELYKRPKMTYPISIDFRHFSWWLECDGTFGTSCHNTMPMWTFLCGYSSYSEMKLAFVQIVFCQSYWTVNFYWFFKQCYPTKQTILAQTDTLKSSLRKDVWINHKLVKKEYYVEIVFFLD